MERSTETSGHPDLSQSELKIASELLGYAAEGFQDRGCNDYWLPATNKHREIVAAAIEFNNRNLREGEESGLKEVEDLDTGLAIDDFRLMRFYAYRCEELARSGKSKSGPTRTPSALAGRLSRQELIVVANLLEMLAAADDDDIGSHEDGNEDYTLPATHENKCFVAAVIKNSGDKRWKAKLEQIAQAPEEVSTFVDLVMGYLAKRCKAIAVSRPLTDQAEELPGPVQADGPETVAKIERLGAFKSWRSEKAILKEATDYLDAWVPEGQRNRDDLATYANGGNPFKNVHDKDRPQSPPFADSVSDALRWATLHNMLSARSIFGKEAEDVWLHHLERSTAHRYWAWRAKYGARISRQREHFTEIVELLTACLYLGWMAESRAIASFIRTLYQERCFYDVGDLSGQPLHHWILRICFDYWGMQFDGWGKGSDGTAKNIFAEKNGCFGQPVLNQLFEHWRDPDASPMQDHLVWLCDYYTHQTRGQLHDVLHTRVPAPILAWFRLREKLGLANPAIDHPLLRPSYARMLPSRPFYTDDLLETVLARLRREEIPDLGDLSDVQIEFVERAPDPCECGEFIAIELRKFISPGFGLSFEAPMSWRDRSSQEVFRLIDPVTGTGIIVTGYKNPGVTCLQWADARFSALATAMPHLARIKEPYEVDGLWWWGMAAEYRSRSPGQNGETHYLVLCFRPNLKDPEDLISFIIAAPPMVFAANEALYRWLLRCKLRENSRPELERLPDEMQDVPAFERVAHASQLAETGNLFSEGLAYYYGNGNSYQGVPVPQDYRQAELWLRRAADREHAGAQNIMGILYNEGEGVSQDYVRAVEWFRRAAELGDVHAQFNLGLKYSSGHGVSEDFKQASNWYRKAADQGDAGAQNNLGILYKSGQGVAQDYKEASAWFRKAAEQGNADAQYNLGVRYCEGQGVRQDFEQAANWFRKAAEQGNAVAQYNLALMYCKGRGVPEDYEEASVWCRKAAEQGADGSASLLKELMEYRKPFWKLW